MKKLKIIQIGVTHEHAPGKMTTLQLMDDLFDIVGYVDDRQFVNTPFYTVRGLALYDKLPVMSLQEALNYPGLDAVTVEVPNNELVPIAMECMKRKIPMHMDKPAGIDLALYKELLAGCKRQNIPFQMGYMYRSNPAFQFCLKAARANWLGEIFEVSADMNHDYGDGTYDAYLGKFKGGIVYNLGCHFFDFFLSLLGKPERVTSFLRSTPGVPSANHNSGMTVLEYPHATAVFKASAHAPLGIPRRRLKICGTKGAIELSPLELFNAPWEMEMILKEGNEEFAAGTHRIQLPLVRDRYEAQLREFAAMIRGEMSSPYSFEHDYLVHKITLKAAGIPLEEDNLDEDKANLIRFL